MTTAAVKVGVWPRIHAEIRFDGRGYLGLLDINGARHGFSSTSIQGMRAGVIARCVRVAADLGRPVRLDVDEAGTTYGHLAVRPTGIVQLVNPSDMIADASTLLPYTGPCRNCSAIVAVTDAACGTCGVADPSQIIAPVRPPVEAPAPEVAEPVELVAEVVADPAPIVSTEEGDVEIEGTVLVRSARPSITVEVAGSAPVTEVAPVAIGRGPRAVDGHNAIALPSAAGDVSRTHVLVDVDDAGRLVVTDMESANGTFVDGIEIAPNTPTVVATSAQLGLGDFFVMVRSVPAVVLEEN